MTTPVNDTVSGTLLDGQYVLRTRFNAGTTNTGLGITDAAEQFNASTFPVGVVPSPTSAVVLALGCVGSARRRRR